MDISDITKLILVLGLTFAIVGIAYQLMRLISAVTDNLRDLRMTVKNIGVITDELIEDQKLLKEGVKSFVNVGKKFEEMAQMVEQKIVAPITELFSFVAGLKVMLEKVTRKFPKKVL